MIELHTLDPGAQEPLEVARRVAAFADAAERTLDLALYDVRLPDPAGSVVRQALEGAAERGVAVRLAYNLEQEEERQVPVPPPPETEPDLIESLKLPTLGIPGIPDLMHHKYAVRDGRSVWTGSTNWTNDAWSLQENVIATVESEARGGGLHAQLRGAVEHAPGGPQRAGRAARAGRGRQARSAPGSRPARAATSRTGSRTRSAARRAGCGSPHR